MCGNIIYIEETALKDMFIFKTAEYAKTTRVVVNQEHTVHYHTVNHYKPGYSRINEVHIYSSSTIVIVDR